MSTLLLLFFFAPNEIFRFLFALPDARAHTRVAAEHASSGFGFDSPEQKSICLLARVQQCNHGKSRSFMRIFRVLF